MVIIWTEDLKTGISLIDEQHQGLFETVNKLEKAKENKSTFYEILIEFQTYMSLHFSTEEKYMRYTDYPEFTQHKASHEKFVEDYKNILKKVSQHDEVMDIAPELITFVENWITIHYSNDDLKMAVYLNNNSLDNV